MVNSLVCNLTYCFIDLLFSTRNCTGYINKIVYFTVVYEHILQKLETFALTRWIILIHSEHLLRLIVGIEGK